MLNPFSRRVLLCLTIIAAAHLPTSGAHAGQNRADKDLAGLNLEDLASITIVTAAKKEQRISQVAAAATVINHEQIRRYGYRTIGEALNRISGMSLPVGPQLQLSWRPRVQSSRRLQHQNSCSR